MSTLDVQAPAGVRARSPARPALGSLGSFRRACLSLGTALSILGTALVLLLQPAYLHAALDAARSPEFLAATREETLTLSDRTVGELVRGPGSFAFAGPDGSRFYDPAEASHLRDARAVLYGFLAVVLVGGGLALVILIRGRRDAAAWRAVGRGGGLLAAALTVVGLVFAVTFDAAFEVFHRIFFPGGNWAFDPMTEHIVQLYPIPFWQIVVGSLALLSIGGGLAVWWAAGRRARRLAADEAGRLAADEARRLNGRSEGAAP